MELADMDKLLESSKILSLNLQALSSKLGLVHNEVQALSSLSGLEFLLFLAFYCQIYFKTKFFFNRETS